MYLSFSTLEMQWKSGSSPAEALLHHWSTYGKKQPDLLDLVKFLKAAGLLRAGMEVQNDLLKSNFIICYYIHKLLRKGNMCFIMYNHLLYHLT